MNPDLQQLRDIHDTLGHPWWPLAPGWWLLLIGALALIVLMWKWRSTWRLYLPTQLITLGDWRWEAGRALRHLRHDLRSGSVKGQAERLSELLRRIAMARHGRAACAGLHGQEWLRWLSAHDPAGFDWSREGAMLITAPYAPADRFTDSQRLELARLVNAAERWITQRAPRRAPPKRKSSRDQGFSQGKTRRRAQSASSAPVSHQEPAA